MQYIQTHAFNPVRTDGFLIKPKDACSLLRTEMERFVEPITVC